MVNISKLSNGIRVVLEEIPYVRSISFGIWVKNGSRNETEDYNGISHFIEHMLFKGTKTRSAKDIAEEMDFVGGQINAYTTKEYTCFHTRTLDKHFDSALNVMSDMILNSVFDEEEIKKERNVIIEEINMYEDSPEDLVHDSLQEGIWKGSSIGLPILGTVESISRFNTNIIKDYYINNYHTDNIVLSAAGNFKTEEMLEMLEKYFGEYKSDKPYVSKVAKAKYVPVTINKEKNIEQVHLCLAFEGIERDNPDKYALTVLNTIFGGGMSSRLFQKIREENGLTYSIYSYISSYTDSGLFAIYAGMSPNQTERVVKLVFDEIHKLKKESISEKIILKTKEQIISNYIIGTESTVNRMTSSGGSVLLRNSVQTQEEIIEKFENITSKDIDKVIEKIFNFESLSLSFVGKNDFIDADRIIENARKSISKK